MRYALDEEHLLGLPSGRQGAHAEDGSLGAAHRVVVQSPTGGSSSRVLVVMEMKLFITRPALEGRQTMRRGIAKTRS